MSNKAIILIQAIDQPLQAFFDDPLARSLKEIGKMDFFSCDSLSDQSVLYPLKKLIGEKDKVYMVFDMRISSNIGAAQSLLNSFLKSKNIHLMCLGNPGKLVPFLKLFKGDTFDSEKSLLAYFSSN